MSRDPLTNHPDVGRALSDLVRDLGAAIPTELVGIALYGGLAKGRYTPGISDVNVLVLLRSADFATLDRAAGPLTAARRTSAVTPLVLTEAELQEVADLFPVKLADIKAAHRVLHGEVPLERVRIDPGALERRVRQELVNMTLRARDAAAVHAGEPELLWHHVMRTLPKLAVMLETLARARGQHVPPDRAGVLRLAGEQLGLGAELAPFVDLHRHAPRPSEQDVPSLMDAWIRLLDRLRSGIGGAQR